MKILHTVESYLPLSNGMSEVVRQLSERLVKAGHEVTVATSYYDKRTINKINGVEIKSFKIKGNIVKGIEGEAGSYKDFLLNNNFDLITNFAAQQWATDLCIELLPLIKAKKVFVPTGFSALNDTSYGLYFQNMRSWMKLYDMNVFLSEDYKDIDFARKNNIQRRIIITNGAAKDEFYKENLNFSLSEYLGLPENYRIILHVGSYTGYKGHDQALDIFMRSTVCNTALVFIGENFGDKIAYPFIQKLNWFKNFSVRHKFDKGSLTSLFLYFQYKTKNKTKDVYTISLKRAQVVAAYKEADLFLFPSMIECSPIVLFEAMASNTPFLVTDVGNTREIIKWSDAGEILPTKLDKNGYSIAKIKESSNKLSSLLKDKDQLNVYARNGFNSWSKRFTWEYITQQYEELYINLVNEKQIQSSMAI